MTACVHALVAGGKMPRVNAVGATATDTALEPNEAFASIFVQGTQIRKIQGVSNTLVANWVLVGVPADYEIMVTGTGDVPDGDAINVWINCSLNPAWSHTRTTLGTDSFNGTYSLRRAGHPVVLDTVNCDIIAIQDV